MLEREAVVFFRCKPTPSENHGHRGVVGGEPCYLNLLRVNVRIPLPFHISPCSFVKSNINHNSSGTGHNSFWSIYFRCLVATGHL